NMPIGPFDDTIEVVTNRRPLNIPVFGKVVGDLDVDPPQVSFGIVPHGQGAIRLLKLTSSASKPITVTGVSTNSNSVKAKVEPVSPGKEYKITAELLHGTPDGQLRGELKISNHAPQQATL